MKEKFITSALYMTESAELAEKIKQELEIPDPELEVAESVLKEQSDEVKSNKC